MGWTRRSGTSCRGKQGLLPFRRGRNTVAEVVEEGTTDEHTRVVLGEGALYSEKIKRKLEQFLERELRFKPSNAPRPHVAVNGESVWSKNLAEIVSLLAGWRWPEKLEAKGGRGGETEE
jgi:hypothetical protein